MAAGVQNVRVILIDDKARAPLKNMRSFVATVAFSANIVADAQASIVKQSRGVFGFPIRSVEVAKAIAA